MRLPCWAAAGWRSLLSAPPGDVPFTQHNPAHCRAALASPSVPYKLLFKCDYFAI
ncbi:MAG TPA: hypothetical protein VMW34_05875 [Anaerolineales bacterium]|nr:hypothetical protein [Anaerolineales bacterium]